MQKRYNFEFCGDAIFCKINAYENTGSREHGHFRVPDIEGLTAREGQADWLKRTTCEHLSKRLHCHTADCSRLTV